MHVTETCLDEARNQGVKDLIENLKDKVESTQELVGFEFLSASSLKKRIGKSVRLIVRQHLAGNNALILFLRVLTRGGNDYERILHNPASISRFRPYREDEIADILNCRTQGESPVRLRPPNDPAVSGRGKHGLDGDEGESYPFWETPTIKELTRAQRVKPIANIESLFGTWPGDDDDGFEEAIDELRHPGKNE